MEGLVFFLEGEWHYACIRRTLMENKYFYCSLVKLLVKYILCIHISLCSFLFLLLLLLLLISQSSFSEGNIYERHNEILIKLKQQAELKDEMCAF